MHHSTPQPVKGVLATRRIPNTRVAVVLGKSPHWVGKVLNGHVHAPESFRHAVAALLEMPEDELFRADGR